jgi:hypothetical protein
MYDKEGTENGSWYKLFSSTWREPILPYQSRSELTKSLYSTLHWFRYENDSLYIWADAVCIDLWDQYEHSLQVSMQLFELAKLKTSGHNRHDLKKASIFTDLEQSDHKTIAQLQNTIDKLEKAKQGKDEFTKNFRAPSSKISTYRRLPNMFSSRPSGTLPIVPGWLGKKKVEPLGDLGASDNCMWLGFAKRNGYKIKWHKARVMKVMNGKAVEVVGTVTSEYRF